MSAFAKTFRATSAAAAAASALFYAAPVSTTSQINASPTTSSSARCRPVILCGPSGAGKSTLISKLQKEFPEDFGFSVSHTTRAPRKGEEQGVHYHFVEKPEMEKEITEGKFLEHANVHGNLYGTSFDAVSDVSNKCVICILDIDIQGVKSCHKRAFDGLYIFVAPPTIADLEKRLVHRGTETPDRIRKRVENAVGELDESKRLTWDEYIVNDHVEEAYAKLKAAIKKAQEECALYRAQQKAHSS